ncbi:unnamed protein product [Euphydryas editha]|uniref:Uncharacterized protein n=1 Tax=Euphydryas editha TaxID=104508 RepID=A0AAU9VD70_EUPED|nr:unnamed protein product [Euphydryas editha]
MVKNFQEKLKSIKKHIFNMKTQFKNFRRCVDEIRSNEDVILVDFRKNYICKCTEEIQAHQFGDSHNQVTLHTVVFYVYRVNVSKQSALNMERNYVKKKEPPWYTVEDVRRQWKMSQINGRHLDKLVNTMEYPLLIFITV